VLRAVHERLADPTDKSVWWPLCVMRACYDAHILHDLLAYAAPATPWAEVSKTRQALFDSLSAEENFFWKDNDSRCEARYDGIFTAARALAEARAPGHPWIRRLAAEQDCARGRIDRATQIALLETVIREGLEDNFTAYLLLDARLEVLGVEKTLKQAPSPLSSALWTDRFISDIDSHLDRAIDALPLERQEIARRDLQDMEQWYYEQAIARMERFFETGKGHVYDASLNIYSRMLRSLAFIYRAARRNREAIDLNRRGLAVGGPPSDQYAHHHDILNASDNLDDYETIIQSAETLWQLSATLEKRREYWPESYMDIVAQALYELGRAREIPIWLERLTRWEREVERLDEDNLPDDALWLRLTLALYITAADENKEISRRVWQGIAAQVERRESEERWKHEELWDLAADLLYELEEWEAAIPFYERVLRVKHDERAAEFLARCQQKLAEKNAPPKRWRQVWK
jgi:tetratricopeptide (TPR) repeat protein